MDWWGLAAFLAGAAAAAGVGWQIWRSETDRGVDAWHFHRDSGETLPGRWQVVHVAHRVVGPLRAYYVGLVVPKDNSVIVADGPHGRTAVLSAEGPTIECTIQYLLDAPDPWIGVTYYSGRSLHVACGRRVHLADGHIELLRRRRWPRLIRVADRRLPLVVRPGVWVPRTQRQRPADLPE